MTKIEAEAVREACAKVCEEFHKTAGTNVDFLHHYGDKFASVIRALDLSAFTNAATAAPMPPAESAMKRDDEHDHVYLYLLLLGVVVFVSALILAWVLA